MPEPKDYDRYNKSVEVEIKRLLDREEERLRIPEEPDMLEVAQAIPEKAGVMPTPIMAGSERFYELLKEIGELHARKQADYGTNEDPFANVRGAAEWGTAPWVGAMIRATDKVRRLQKYARTGKLSNEGARDSFMDLAVYALIALILWEEETYTLEGGE